MAGRRVRQVRVEVGSSLRGCVRCEEGAGAPPLPRVGSQTRRHSLRPVPVPRRRAPGRPVSAAAFGALVLLALALATAWAAPQQHPLFNKPERATATCQKVSGMPFCSMVNYEVPLNATYTAAMLDAQAATIVAMMKSRLSRFDCALEYSLHSCAECEDAYKYWACSSMFERCAPEGVATHGDPLDGGPPVVHTCLSLCEDVVRRCPYTLNFKCPGHDSKLAMGPTGMYSTNIATCNKLDRTTVPVPMRARGTRDIVEAWPPTFFDAA